MYAVPVIALLLVRKHVFTAKKQHHLKMNKVDNLCKFPCPYLLTNKIVPPLCFMSSYLLPQGFYVIVSVTTGVLCHNICYHKGFMSMYLLQQGLLQFYNILGYVSIFKITVQPSS